MSEPDGGQAFPKSGCGWIGLGAEDGMTLRDYFAAKAMQGIRASRVGEAYSKEMMAQLAYADADALLAHRQPRT